MVMVQMELAQPSQLQLSLNCPPLPLATTKMLPNPFLPAITPCCSAACGEKTNHVGRKKTNHDYRSKWSGVPPLEDQSSISHSDSYLAQRMGSIDCASIIFWTPTREEKNLVLKNTSRGESGRHSPTRSCLLPAAVDVVDLIVLIEGYGLQAVSQRTIQDSYTWMESSECQQVARSSSYFAVGHRGSEANSHFYLPPCCHRQPQQHRRCCWEPLLFRRHTVSHDGCCCGSLDEALGPGRWSSGHNCLLDSGETFRFRFRFYLSISPHVPDIERN